MKRSAIVFGFSLFLMGNQSAALTPAVMVSVDGYVFTESFPFGIDTIPIEGVKVYLQPQMAVLMDPATILPVYLDSSVTNSTGRFVFKMVTAGSYTVSLQHKDFATRNYPFTAMKNTTLKLALLPRGAYGRMEGKVRVQVMTFVPGNDPNIPVPLCTVTVSMDPIYYPVLWNDSKAPLPLTSYSAVTDRQGVFSIDSIPISCNNTPVRATTSKEGFCSQTVERSLWNRHTTREVLFSLRSCRRDTVKLTPVYPTSGDSIAFSLYKATTCACAVFVNHLVIISDSMVVLSYSLDTKQCDICRSDFPGVWHTFRSKPLKAGKYGIYTQEGCPPDQICTMVMNPPVRIGEFIVKNTLTPVQPVAAEPVLSGPVTLKQERNSVTLYGAHANAGNIRVQIFNSRGILAGEMHHEQAAPGSFRFSWTAKARGIYLLAVKADGAPVSFHRVVISR